VRPLTGSRVVMPTGEPTPPFAPRSHERDARERDRDPAPFQPREREHAPPPPAREHSTPVTRLPVPPRPPERTPPSDLEIPTFIRRQMD
jgi:cell division protein FtsZ